MSSLSLWAAAIFLPLFPASMLFNLAKARIPNRWARAAVILAWPQVGVALLSRATNHESDHVPAHAAGQEAGQAAGQVAGHVGMEIPEGLLWLALATSLLYAVRMLAMRDVSRWIGFLATSNWSLLWLASTIDGLPAQQFHLFALWFSVPVAMLSVFVGNLKKSFGAAYTGINMALSTSLPRLSGVLVIGVLGAIATPVFPGFFVMLNLLGTSAVVFGLLLLTIWFVWSWAAAQMIQGLIVGTREPDGAADLSLPGSWLSALVFVSLVVAGVLMTEVLA